MAQVDEGLTEHGHGDPLRRGHGGGRVGEREGSRLHWGPSDDTVLTGAGFFCCIGCGPAVLPEPLSFEGGTTMANEDSIVYRPMGAWAHDVGDYNCRCWIKEDPGGSCVITVVENGMELEREMAGRSHETQERGVPRGSRVFVHPVLVHL